MFCVGETVRRKVIKASYVKLWLALDQSFNLMLKLDTFINQVGTTKQLNNNYSTSEQPGKRLTKE